MDKADVVHIYTIEYHSVMKRNEIMPFSAPWMDLEIIILSEVFIILNHIENGKYHILLICGILK